MGYFSNGSEGADYEERYCRRCVHDVNHDCPVLLIHVIYNYDQIDDKGSGETTLGNILGAFIPVSEDRLSNEQCTMFMPLKEATDGDTRE